MEKLLKNFFLFISKNKTLTKFAKKYGLRFGAKRFVAGQTIEEAIQIVKQLNQKNLFVTLDYLGEFVDSKEEALWMTKQSMKALEVIHREKANSQLSLKMTSMGLDISNELVDEHMRMILKTAKETNNFVTIDMEDYSRLDKTLDIFRNLRKDFQNVGTVVQSYLYRTENDIQELNIISANLRIVKGAYKESPEVAFPDKKDVDSNYLKLVKIHLQNGNFTAIATHDEKIIQQVKEFVSEMKIPKTQYEFQMLYGIRTELQDTLVREGYPMRVYVPYGVDWYGYFMRRLAERPANVWFILRSLFRK